MDLHWQEHHEEDQFAVDRLQAMGITYHPADHASSGSDRNTSSRSLTNGKKQEDHFQPLGCYIQDSLPFALVVSNVC